MSSKETSPFSEMYLAWLTELLPLHFQSYLLQVANEKAGKTAVNHQEMMITSQGYDLLIEVARINELPVVSEKTTSPNLLHQIAQEKFESTVNLEEVSRPVLFSSANFPHSPALNTIKSNPDNQYFGFRAYTEHFSAGELPPILAALKSGALTIQDLTEWQRPRIIPSTYLLKLPKLATANPNSKITVHTEVEADSYFFPSKASIASQILENLPLKLDDFAFDANLRSLRKFDNAENADLIINILLATQLMEKTAHFETTEEIYAYLEDQKIDLDFDALQRILVQMVTKKLYMPELVSLGVVTTSFSLQDQYQNITRWLVVCAQQFLVRNRSKYLHPPFSYTELDIPLDFIPCVMNSFLLFALELPPLLNSINNSSGKVPSPWPKLLATARHMIGDEPGTKKNAEELIVSYFDRVILEKINTFFKKEYQNAFDDYQKNNERNPHLLEQTQVVVTVNTLNQYFEQIPTDLQDEIISQIPAIQKAKEQIGKIITFYGKNPEYLTVGQPKDKIEESSVASIAEHLTIHGLRTAVNQAGGRPRKSNWGKLFKED